MRLFFQTKKWSEKKKLNDVAIAIQTGRFDKTKLNLPVTVILGEDGGMYALINSIYKDEYEQIKSDALKEEMNIEFLKEKTVGDKIILGKGGFG